jgi:ankyrin repeat protein
MKRALPAHASLEYLRKAAKDSLRELRRLRPDTKLAEAQHRLAQEHGFKSWRALKENVEAARNDGATSFFAACDAADLPRIERLLAADPTLVHERHSHHRRTALHRAAIAQQLDVVRLLLAQGADPNARDAGDNVYAHHHAAEAGAVEIVAACLDAGGDVHGEGDVHQMGLIGWALCLNGYHPGVAQLLLARGARHHVWSTIAVADADALQDLVEADPNVLEQRMSRFEHAATPLHFAAARAEVRMVELLIQLGAALEATDDRGRTPLESALLRARAESAAALRRAGAKEPQRSATVSFEHATPILPVKDLLRSIAYYEQKLGFGKVWQAGEPPTFACVRHDDASLFLSQGSYHGTPPVWVFIGVENVDTLQRQYQASGATISNPPQDYPWGSREMHVADPDGNRLRLASPVRNE